MVNRPAFVIGKAVLVDRATGVRTEAGKFAAAAKGSQVPFVRNVIEFVQAHLSFFVSAGQLFIFFLIIRELVGSLFANKRPAAAAKEPGGGHAARPKAKRR